MLNKTLSLIALKLVWMRIPPNPLPHPEYPMDYNPEDVTIPDDLHQTCLAVRANPAEYPTLPNSLRAMIGNMNKNGIDKKTRSRFRLRISFYHLWKANGCKCYLCDEHLPFDKATRDHVYPKAHGFSLGYNHMPACQSCNTEKGDDLPTARQVLKTYLAYRRCGRWFYPKMKKEKKVRLRWRSPLIVRIE